MTRSHDSKMPGWAGPVRCNYNALIFTPSHRAPTILITPGQARQDRQLVVQKSICSRVHLLCSSAQWRQIFWRSNAIICRTALSPEPGPRWGQTGPGNYCNLPTSEYEGQVDRVQPRCDWELRLIKNCPVSPEFPVLSIKGSQWWFGCWDVVDLCESDY